MINKAKYSAVRSLGELMLAISGEKTFSSTELSHIAEVLCALGESPGSVSVDRCKLRVVWPDATNYLRDKTLIFLVTPDQYKKRENIARILVESGLSARTFLIATRCDKGINTLISSVSCAAVVCTKGSAHGLGKFIAVKKNVTCMNISEKSLRGAIAELAKKLK